MTAQLLFYIIVGIIILNFIIDKIIGKLNAKHYNDPIPEELKDVYKEEEYKKSQAPIINLGFSLLLFQLL